MPGEVFAIVNDDLGGLVSASPDPAFHQFSELLPAWRRDSTIPGGFPEDNGNTPSSIGSHGAGNREQGQCMGDRKR